MPTWPSGKKGRVPRTNNSRGQGTMPLGSTYKNESQDNQICSSTFPKSHQAGKRNKINILLYMLYVTTKILHIETMTESTCLYKHQ